jgi:hypothetical protein
MVVDQLTLEALDEVAELLEVAAFPPVICCSSLDLGKPADLNAGRIGILKKNKDRVKIAITEKKCATKSKNN